MTAKPRTYIPLALLVTIIICGFGGCAILKNAFKAKYDPVGFQYAVTLNTLAHKILAKAAAKESYTPNANDVYHMMSKVEEAYEHARRQKKNNTIIGIWNVMRNPHGNRLAKLMADWKTYDILDPDTVATYTKWIDADFKHIAKLEGAKKK